MALVTKLTGLIRLATSLALHPALPASLLYALTLAPTGIRSLLLDAVPALRDPRTLARTVRTLGSVFAVGVLGRGSQALNRYVFVF
jgi:hypothetical protein